MNRFWIIGGVLVLAGIVGWLTAGNEATLDTVPVLADVITPGCDAPGQVHLTIGNASGRGIANLEGVLSVAFSADETPTPIGNFELSGPFASGEATKACVPVEEARLEGRARTTVVWLARTTVVRFVE